MARVNTTKYEIIQLATKQILEKGYSATTPRAICEELDLSTGNLTYYFPTKEHLLAELVEMLCDFQWKMMEEEADEGLSSVMAVCLELSSMAVMCEEDEIVREFYLATYSSPICLDMIRKNDAARASTVFRSYCPDWDDEQFAEAEIIVSGIEYATLMTTDDSVSLEARIEGALNAILSIYCVPEDIRKAKIEKVLAMDYKKIGRRVLRDFKKFVAKTNEQTFKDLKKGRN
ncbi:MAG: TetR/AcrR family transcriptional regulator [Clostridia bacterium]|nr:TetR/AcrR family transcriptional regulator [Clostridia bacterium]